MPGEDWPEDRRPQERPSQDALENLQELLEHHGLPEEKIENWIKIAATKPSIFHKLKEVYERDPTKTVLTDPFHPYDSYRGQFRIGTNPDGEPVGLTAEELNEHLMAVGRSGAGKTTFFLNLIDTCIGEHVPFLIFDFQERLSASGSTP